MSVLPFPKPPERQDVRHSIDAFESETVEVLARARPRHERATLYLLAGVFAVALLFMALAHLPRVVTAPGEIVPIAGTLVVQPLEKAIIRSINVQVGDIVKKGQVLAKLDATFAAADLAELTQKAASLEAEVARLRAEQDGRDYAAQASSPYGLLQASIFEQRRAELKATLADFDARVSGAQAEIAKLQQDIDLSTTRLKLATDIETMRTELEKRDVGSRLNSLLATDNRVEVAQNLAASQNTLAATRHELESIRAQREVALQKWRSDLATELVAKSNDLEATREQLAKAQKLRDLIDLTAPEDAVVLKIADLSVGSVAQEAEALFTLVPLDAPIEAEVMIDEQDIGFIQPGDKAEIKLDAYRFMQHGTAKGVVKTVSQDSFTEMANHQTRTPFFKGRITLTDVHLRNVPASFRLIPGMTLQGDIVVGKRSILSYLVEGALRTGSEAMREP